MVRIRKTYNLNSEVVKEFEESVPEFYRSKVLDVLMIKYLIEEGEKYQEFLDKKIQQGNIGDFFYDD